MTTQHGQRCTLCGDEIYSNSRHDFVSCKCGDAFVDGGFDYMRCGAMNLSTLVPISREVDRAALPHYFREEAGE